MTDARLRRAAWGVALAAALAFPLAAQNAYLTSVVATGFILAIAVYGLDILLGDAGQLSLAHGGFLGVGAYTAGLLMTRVDLSFWLALPAAIALTAVLGFLVGMIALRTRGDYFAIFTLAVGVIITIIIDRWESLTGGTDGLIGIPPPTALGPIDFGSVTAQYYLALVLLMIAMLATYRIRHSLLGRALRAIHTSEELAAAVGIDVGRRKRLAFAISAAYAGAAGALYAPFLGYIGPSLSSFVMTFNLLLYLLLGGVATLAGPIVGTLVVLGLTQTLQLFADYQPIILGPVLVLIVIFFPHGLVGLGQMVRRRFRRPAPPSPVETSSSFPEEPLHAATGREAGD
ncbi:MAG TPA: branched-chain amino acid ABC transporter permease [Longimicrobiaceae bacterium]|nr:branched-chain amino acid ABC transporter permease [Longimicrobiaceae bacterium]